MTTTASAALTDVCLFVTDMDRAVAFYRDRVGLTVKRLDTGFAEFWTGGVILALWLRADIAANVGIEEALEARGASVMVAVKLDSAEAVDAEYRRLLAAGVAFRAEPRLYPWNAYAAYFSDPDGTVWELYHWSGAPRVLPGSP